MKSIIYEINNLETGKKQKGRLFDQKNSWGFDQLIAWTYRNCRPSELKIVPEKKVICLFDDRIETYYFQQIKNNWRNDININVKEI